MPPGHSESSESCRLCCRTPVSHSVAAGESPPSIWSPADALLSSLPLWPIRLSRRAPGQQVRPLPDAPEHHRNSGEPSTPQEDKPDDVEATHEFTATSCTPTTTSRALTTTEDAATIKPKTHATIVSFSGDLVPLGEPPFFLAVRSRFSARD